MADTSPEIPVDRRLGDLHLQLRGTGRPVLLLHGNGEDLHVFDPLATALAPHRTVVALDSRGHGASQRGRGPLTIDRMADDAAAVVRTPWRPWDVVGFSDGANVAMALAVRHPRAVRSLVLLSGNTEPAGLTTGSRIGIEAAGAVLRTLAPLSRRVARRAEIWRLMTHDPHITAEQLGRIAVPTLVVAGQRDAIRPEHTRAIAAAIPGSRLLIVPGGDHFLITRHPGLVTDIVADFLHAVDAGTARDAEEPGSRGNLDSSTVAGGTGHLAPPSPRRSGDLDLPPGGPAFPGASPAS